jgi:hypothetical protein
MEGVLAESSGVLSLVSAEIEVMQGNGGCNGHTLNRWHMRIWFAPFATCSRGCSGSTR